MKFIYFKILFNLEVNVFKSIKKKFYISCESKYISTKNISQLGYFNCHWIRKVPAYAAYTMKRE